MKGQICLDNCVGRGYKGLPIKTAREGIMKISSAINNLVLVLIILVVGLVTLHENRLVLA